jgi:hypothetical protein
MKGGAFVNSRDSVVLRSRRLETGEQSEIQKEYSERFVIQKEFNV